MYLVLLEMMCSDPCTDWFARLGDLFYQLFHFAMCRTLSRLDARWSPTERPRDTRASMLLRRSAACATSMCGASHPRCNGLGVIGGGLQYTLVDRAGGGCLGATSVSAEVSLTVKSRSVGCRMDATTKKTLTESASRLGAP